MATKNKPFKIIDSQKNVLLTLKLKRFKGHRSLTPLNNNVLMLNDESIITRLTDSKIQEIVWKKYTCSVCGTSESFFVGEKNEILCEHCYDFHYHKEESFLDKLINTPKEFVGHTVTSLEEVYVEDQTEENTRKKEKRAILTPSEKLMLELESLELESHNTSNRLDKFNQRLDKIEEPRVKKERVKIQKSSDPYLLQNTHYLNTTIMLLEELNDFRNRCISLAGEESLDLGSKYYLLKDVTRFNLNQLIDKDYSYDELVQKLAYGNHRYSHQQEMLKSKLERKYATDTINAQELHYINRNNNCEITGEKLINPVYVNVLTGELVENNVSVKDIPFIIKTETHYADLFKQNNFIDVMLYISLNLEENFKPSLIIRGLMQLHLVCLNKQLNEIMKSAELNMLQMEFSSFWKLHLNRLCELLGEYNINQNLFNIDEIILIIEELNAFYSSEK